MIFIEYFNYFYKKLIEFFNKIFPVVFWMYNETEKKLIKNAEKWLRSFDHYNKIYSIKNMLNYNIIIISSIKYFDYTQSFNNLHKNNVSQLIFFLKTWEYYCV